MIVEVLSALASILLLCGSMAMRPTRATCPDRDWYVEGIRPSGRFTCKRTPTGRENDSPTRPGFVTSQLHCTGGTRPIVVNYRAVGCQRR